MRSEREKFEASFVPVPESGCWLWDRAVGNHGYGVMRRSDGSTITAHRFAFEEFIGPIPEGANVLHRCDTRSCCNPAHLFAGSQLDNVQDCIAKGRFVVRVKHGEAVVSEIRRRYAADRRPRKIARDMGVNFWLVHSVVYGRRRVN